MKKYIILSLVLICFVSCKQNKENVIEPTNIEYTYEYSVQEMELLTIVNDYRESVGLNRLEKVNYVSLKCAGHNDYMIKKQVVNHDYFQNRADSIKAIVGADRVGENIAYNYMTSESALRAWIKSDGHRKNLEGDYTEMGVSITIDSVTRKKYYTNIFIRKLK